MMLTGLALAGGGAKGIYQIGAWKALDEHQLSVNVICGTSIGAINGALIAQGDFQKALHMWQHLKMDQCLAFSSTSELATAKQLCIKDADKLLIEYVKNHGLDTSPFRELLSAYIDEYQVRQSGICYGLMTATLPEIRSAGTWLDQIPKNQLIDYLMASSRLPGLKPVKINDLTYVDGGFIENLPISMLTSQGVREIIAVDLRRGSNHKLSNYPCRPLTYISNRLDLGQTFDISPETLKKSISLGYLDTCKALGDLGGEYFYFHDQDYRDMLQRYGTDILLGLEQAALAYDMDRTVVWKPEGFIREISDRRQVYTKAYHEARKELQVDRKLQQLVHGKLRTLKMVPAMRLSFLLEVISEFHHEQSYMRLPLKLFKNLDLAGKALCFLDKENAVPKLSTATHDQKASSQSTSYERFVPDILTAPFEGLAVARTRPNTEITF